MIQNHRTMLAVVLLANATLLATGLMLTRHSTLFALLPVAAYAALVAAAFGLAVVSGQRWASGALLFVVIIVFAINLRGDVATVERQQFDLVSASKLGLYVVAFLCGLAVIARTYRTLLEVPAVLLVAYLALAIATAPISLTPAYSAGMAFALTAWLLFAAALCQKYAASHLLVIMVAAAAVFCICSLAAYYVFPEYGRFVSLQVGVTRLKGLAATPNEAAQVAALLLIGVLCLHLSGFRHSTSFQRFGTWLRLACIPAIAVLLMTGSRGALAALAATAAALVLQRLGLGRVALAGGLLALLMAIMAVVALPDLGSAAERNASALSRSGDASEVSSLAGRANIWGFSADHIAEKPLIGYGFGASSRLIQQEYQTRWGETTGSAHNAFLQSALDLGLIGAALLASIFVWSFWKFLYYPSPFRDGMFVFVLLTCLLESGVSKPTSALALIWLLSLMSTPEEPQRDGGAAASGPRHVADTTGAPRDGGDRGIMRRVVR